jgi:hypothetical protein
MTGDKWSRAVVLTEVAPGDVLRFEPAGHHIAIITRAAATPGGMRLGLAHSNEAYFLDPADGVFVGDVDLASADSTDAIGAKRKAAIPVIMGDSSTFVGFQRLATRLDSKDDKKLGDSRFDGVEIPQTGSEPAIPLRRCTRHSRDRPGIADDHCGFQRMSH